MAKSNPFRFSNKYQDDETDLLYYGHRYHNASMGRWLSRDPMGEEAFRALISYSIEAVVESEVDGDVTKPPYLFVANCPPNNVDALGLWATTSPWYGRFVNLGTALPLTHDNANNREIPGSSSEVGIISMAGVYLDTIGQGTELSYQHAMRAPGEAKAVAKARANYWVRSNMRAAQQAYCSCGAMDHVTALWYFGLALHPVQDSTDPAHHGFQVWHGVSNPFWWPAAEWHIAREAFDPGPGSRVDAATKWLWGFMKCPPPRLPADFFIYPADHEHLW